MTERGQSRHGRFATSSVRARVLAFVIALSSVAFACAGARVSHAEPKNAARTAARAEASGVRAELSSAEVSNGHAVVLTVLLPEGVAAENLQARFGDQELVFFEPTSTALAAIRAQDGSRAAASGAGSIRQAFFGVPFEQAPGEARVRVEVAEKSRPVVLELPLRVVAGDYVIESLKVDGKHVNPGKKAMVRIAAEQREIGAIYRKVGGTRFWDGPFVLPIESAVTSRYGNKRVYNGEMRNYHSGTDLRAGVGAPIRAAQNGTVVLAKDLYFSGNTVILDHGHGFLTMYAHLSQLKSKKGQVVKTGDLIGLAGATGRVSGPHLHWTWILNRVKVDPMQAIQVLK